MDFITEFNKKHEKVAYLACSKWGSNCDILKGKAKYNKKAAYYYKYMKVIWIIII